VKKRENFLQTLDPIKSVELINEYDAYKVEEYSFDD